MKEPLSVTFDLPAFPLRLGSGSVWNCEISNAERSLAHSADAHGVEPVSSALHPQPSHPRTAARHRVNKGQGAPLPDHQKPVLCLRAEGRRRAGKGRPGPRLSLWPKGCVDANGDTGPQRAHSFSFKGRGAPPLRLSRPAVRKDKR